MNYALVVFGVIFCGAPAAAAEASRNPPPPPPASMAKPREAPRQPDMNKPLTNFTLADLNLILEASKASSDASCKGPIAQAKIQELIKQVTPAQAKK